MKVLGRHIIAEMYGCDSGLLSDLGKSIAILREAVEASGATYLGELHERFEPWGGVTAIIALAESHISLHTWPEYGYAALDIFTCGERADPWKAYEHVVKSFKPAKVNVTEMVRGLIRMGKPQEAR
jgi:S-adenosylmethionine decarboxylase